MPFECEVFVGMAVVENVKEKRRKIRQLITVIVIGICMLVILSFFAVRLEFKSGDKLMLSTMSILKQQCISYDNLMESEQERILHDLSDSITELTHRLAYDDEHFDDAALEAFADEHKLTGIAVYNEAKQLEISGYTRDMENPEWTEYIYSETVDEVLTEDSEMFAKRIKADEKYYDIVIAKRMDAPGFVMGYTIQPTYVVSDMESELENLLQGIHMEKNGSFIVGRRGKPIATTTNLSDGGTFQDESDLMECLGSVPTGDSLRSFRYAGKNYYGTRALIGDYEICIFFPPASLFATTLTIIVIYILIYAGLCLFIQAVRNRSLSEKQHELEIANQKLKENISILQSLENVYYSVFYVDLKKNRYRSIVMASWLEELGSAEGCYTRFLEALLQEAVLEEYHDELRSRLSIESIERELSNERLSVVHKSFYIDYEVKRKDGNTWGRVTIILVDLDDTGNPAHVLVVLQDVYNEKAREARYQAKIIEKAQAAQEANEAKTEFLRRVSHDIRTPVNGIRGYLNIAEKFPNDEEKQQMCRERIKLSLTFMLDLVNNIRDMSRLDSGLFVLESKPFVLHELLAEVDALVRVQAEDNGISYIIDHNLENYPAQRLIGSPLHLRQILLNLAVNSVKYGKKGGYIKVVVKLVAEFNGVATFEFICEDNGRGMSESFQKHAFEPFAREAYEDKGASGSGLGLAIVKRLVDIMDGSISFVSEKNVGTTFTIRLPFAVDTALPDINEPIEHGMTVEALKGMRCLIVEDNELDAEILEYMLAQKGIITERAGDVEKAAELFERSQAGYYDMIIMADGIPLKGGVEAVRHIRSLGRRDAKLIPIVGTYANTFVDDIKKNINAGMNGYVLKPIDEEELFSTLLRCL